MTNEAIKALEFLATSTIANALDELGITGVMAGLVAVVPGLRCIGPALTVLEITGSKGSFPPEDFNVGGMIDAAKNGDVVVVDNGGQPVSTWGGLASYAAKLKGIAGLVVDGGVRDREEIEQHMFPAFSRHVVPTTGRTRIRVADIGGPISCGGIAVHPGDIVVADGTGVVCIPSRAVADVADIGTRFAKDDALAQAELNQGLSFREAMLKFAKI
jgi:regulator of RNase E activity RraA